MSTATPTKQNTKRLWLIACALFLASFALRLALAWFDKTYVVYYDETRYFDIARSLWQRGAVLIQGTPSDFQKLLYPLVLSPAFAFGGTAAAIRAIAVINAALASSVVFPVLLMARRVLKSRWGVVLAMVLSLLLPDHAYSMTFMSENLSLPLTLWVMLLLWQVWQTGDTRRKMLYAALGGLCAYILYFGKEMGLAVALAFVLYTALTAVLDKQSRRATLLAGAAFIAAFGLCFVLVKLLVFPGMGGSYNQTGLGYLNSVYKFFYLAYSMLANTTLALVAFFYFPVALLCFRFSHLGRPQRDLFLFTTLCFLLSLAVVSYSISIREDLGMAVPRQHLRYLTPYFIPFLILCTGLFEKSPKERFGFKKPVLAWGAVFTCCAVFCGLVALCVKAMPATLADNTMLKYFANLFCGPLFPYYSSGAGQAPLYLGVLLFKILFILAVIGGSILFMRAPKRVFGLALCAGFVVVSLLNNYLAVRQFRQAYAIPPGQAAAGGEMNEALAGLEGIILVVQGDTLDSPENRLLDTYLSTRHYTIPEGRLKALQEETGGSLDLSQTALNEQLSYVWLYQPVASFTGVDYLLLHANGPTPAEGTAELVGSYCGGLYQLYRPLNSGLLTLEFPAAEEPG